MDFRGFLRHLNGWTLREIACAAGLVTFSAGAGYCIYRILQRERAPPDHTQSTQEPVDVLEESTDTPSVLQVVEPILQLLPTKPHNEPSAVILPLDADEPDSACLDLQCVSAVSSLSQPVDISIGMMRGPESRLCWFETAETHCLTHEGFPYYTSDEEIFTGIQFVEPNIQLLPTEEHQDPSPVFLPLDAGELISACRNIQFLSAEPSISQFKSVEIKTYFLGMIRGPQSRLCWFKTTKTSSLNHMGFPYESSIEDCFTGIQAESGRVTEFISCNRMETSFVVPHYFVQTITAVTCTLLYVAEDGQMFTSTWEYDYNDCEESEERLNPEELEVPFICCHLSDRGVTEIGLKVPILLI
ncbi:uncharacterized protein LOC131365840 [Hemibagrus wyckioides]|uniref:uncharacterized protein LOC131365840 n=1 Tax=Hemibagrus wyckioides TaxID=337641 RepID=UPI00266C61E0|nr:uncharacterized protein LOC131365840 [Hemibagrus wyckioides]